MDNEHLRDSLHQLHAEIQHVDSVDDATRAVLEDLAGDIRALIERQEHTPAHLDHGLRQRLNNNITYFELTHPALSASISRVLDALVQLGV